MHIGIFTLGSRGDVQPYVALALGLLEKGHEVTLGASENLKGFVESFGVRYHKISGNSEEIINSPEGLRLLKKESSVALLKFLSLEGRKIRHQVAEDLLEGCEKVDFIITSFISIYAVATIAEKLNKKWAIVNVNPPFLETKERPILDLGFFNFPLYNKLSYKIFNYINWSINKKDIQELRKWLNLPPLKKPVYKKIYENEVLNIYAISPHLYKRPDDWENHYLMTGFMSLPQEARTKNISEKAPPGLSEWLQKGEKPIYIGFGSIPFPDRKAFLQTLDYLLANTETRIIFSPGWFRVGNLPEHPNFFIVDKINHDWLFPQCKIAVIHGGIGTLTAVLKAQIPPVIVSIFADQPFWGKIISQRNLGAHIPSKKLNADTLLNALDHCTSSEILQNVSKFGQKLKQENGVKSTVEALENYFQN